MISYINKIIILLNKIKEILIKIKIKQRLKKIKNISPKKQDLKVYWSKDFSLELDDWGKNNVWPEIKYFTQFLKGDILDICCGTGSTINYLNSNKNLNLFGFDISDYLIEASKKFNINHQNLKVANAINTGYKNDQFDYSYSIGSLEHFTEDGIEQFIDETSRITKKISMHQIPVAKFKEFQGWLVLDQSYFNMSEAWWLEKFKKKYSKVEVIDSLWSDPISFGKWFVVYK
jgi:ubiquinone/menaquinone biosynthesis C-methylase UbiE